MRASVAARAAQAPRDPDGFVAWFEELEHTGPGQNDPLFPWLAETATMDEMRWFLTQEVAGEAGFEDLAAITQVRLSQRAKLRSRATTGTRWAAAIRRHARPVVGDPRA